MGLAVPTTLAVPVTLVVPTTLQPPPSPCPARPHHAGCPHHAAATAYPLSCSGKAEQAPGSPEGAVVAGSHGLSQPLPSTQSSVRSELSAPARPCRDVSSFLAPFP